MAFSMSPGRWSNTPSRTSASTPSSLPSNDKTNIVAVDVALMASNISRYQSSLNKLREALTDNRWPHVEPTPGEPCGHLIYPGRVLIARTRGSEKDADEQRIWAYLWKINSRGDTRLDFWDESPKQVAMDTTEFKEMDFEPWCVLFARPSCPLGTEGAWETKVKAMVKIALLQDNYFDGTCDGAFSKVGTMLKYIHQMSGPSEVIDLGYPSSDEDFAEDGDNASHVVSIKSGKKVNSTGKGISSQHLERLRKAFPHGVWPTVEDCDEDSSVNYRGRVLVGYYQRSPAYGDPSSMLADGSRVRIWARVGKKANEHRERFGHVKCFFDDGKIANLRYGNLADNIEFDIPFLLVRNNDKNDKMEKKVWRANRAFCIKAALVDAGYLDGAELWASNNVSLSRIVETISSNSSILETKDGVSAQSGRATSVDSVISSNESPYTTPPTSLNETEQGSLQTRSDIISTVPERMDDVRRAPNANSLLVSFQKQPSSTIPTKRPLHNVDSVESRPSTSSRMKTPLPSKSSVADVQRPTLPSPLQRSIDKLPMSTVPTKRPLAHISAAEPGPSTTLQTPTLSSTKPATPQTEYKITPNLNKVFSDAKEVTTLKTRIQTLESDLEAADLRTENAFNDTEHLVAQASEKDKEIAELRQKLTTYQDTYGELAYKFENYVALAKPRLLALGTLEAQAEDVEEGEARILAEKRYVEEFGHVSCEQEEDMADGEL